jgi:hypothetical protein
MRGDLTMTLAHFGVADVDERLWYLDPRWENGQRDLHAEPEVFGEGLFTPAEEALMRRAVLAMSGTCNEEDLLFAEDYDYEDYDYEDLGV